MMSKTEASNRPSEMKNVADSEEETIYPTQTLGIPGRGRGGGPPRPGCAAETGASTLCVAASSPASPPGSPLSCPLAPPASGSDWNTHTHTTRPVISYCSLH